jgi:NTP pyrophosphatase (non-canonical NTP hydrolase)
METQHFEMLVQKHSLCPTNLLYNSNALAGEVGEVANMVKKIQMATIKPEWVLQNENSIPDIEYFKAQLTEELSDALFYLVRVALDNNMSMSSLFLTQLKKLAEQSQKYQRTFLK